MRLLAGQDSSGNGTPFRIELAFDSESFNDDGMHDLATNTDRITVVQDGLYLLGGSAQFAANATGQRLLELYLNSTTPIQYGY